MTRTAANWTTHFITKGMQAFENYGYNESSKAVVATANGRSVTAAKSQDSG